MPKKSKRLASVKILSIGGGLPEETNYCRKCMTIKKSSDFHKAVDGELDKSGLMSVCKSCVDELYEKLFISENSISKAMLRLCRMLNVKYDESVLESTLKQIDNSNWSRSKVFGVYRGRLFQSSSGRIGERTDEDGMFTYQDNPVINMNVNVPSEDEVEYDVVDFWGKGYDSGQYRWLENKLSEWKKTHKCDTMISLTLLKEIVFKQLEIEKARAEGSATGGLIKELQDLMKTAALNVKDNSDDVDSFGQFIAMIERDEPCVVFGEEKDAFKDFQNIGQYYDKYVRGSIGSFMTGSRDFSMDVLDDENNENVFDEFDSNDDLDGEK